MALSRSKLEQQLAELDAAVPGLKDEYQDDGEFWEAFAGLAEPIKDAAGPAEGWVIEQLDAILHRHSLPS